MLDIVDRTAGGRGWAIPPAEVMPRARLPWTASNESSRKPAPDLIRGLFCRKQNSENSRRAINGLCRATVENNPTTSVAAGDWAGLRVQPEAGPRTSLEPAPESSAPSRLRVNPFPAGRRGVVPGNPRLAWGSSLGISFPLDIGPAAALQILAWHGVHRSEESTSRWTTRSAAAPRLAPTGPGTYVPGAPRKPATVQIGRQPGDRRGCF